MWCSSSKATQPPTRREPTVRSTCHRPQRLLDPQRQPQPADVAGRRRRLRDGQHPVIGRDRRQPDQLHHLVVEAGVVRGRPGFPLLGNYSRRRRDRHRRAMDAVTPDQRGPRPLLHNQAPAAARARASQAPLPGCGAQPRMPNPSFRRPRGWGEARGPNWALLAGIRFGREPSDTAGTTSPAQGAAGRSATRDRELIATDRLPARRPWRITNVNIVPPRFPQGRRKQARRRNPHRHCRSSGLPTTPTHRSHRRLGRGGHRARQEARGRRSRLRDRWRPRRRRQEFVEEVAMDVAPKVLGEGAQPRGHRAPRRSRPGDPGRPRPAPALHD